MGNSFIPCKTLELNQKPKVSELSKPSLLVQAGISTRPLNPNLSLCQSELSLIDLCYYSFKPQSKISSTQGYASIFWISRDYSILSKYNSGALKLKSEFDCSLPDEDCLTYFKTLNFLKINVLDYSEKTQGDAVLVSLQVRKRFFGKTMTLVLAFRTFKSAGIYLIGKSFKEKSNEPTIEVFGFSAVRDASNTKTRIFCLAEVERCDWHTRKWMVSWFADVINEMYSFLSR